MDEELIYSKLLNREEEIYQEIIQSYSKLLWVVASTVITSKTQNAVMDIEEVVSDTFIRLWQNPEKFKPKRGSLKNYLAVMTRSLALNKVKKNQRNRLSLFGEEAMEDIGISMSETQEWQSLYDAIATLKEPTKEIFIRRFFYNEKPSMIQQQMNLPAKQIDNLLYRGKKQLKKQLGDQPFMKEGIEYGE